MENSIEKLPHVAVKKNSKPFFVIGILSSARPKNFVFASNDRYTQKKAKMFQNFKNNSKFLSKLQVFKRNCKNLKTIPWPIKKIFQQAIMKLLRRFSGPWVWKYLNNEYNYHKIEKNCKFCKKKIVTFKC